MVWLLLAESWPKPSYSSWEVKGWKPGERRQVSREHADYLLAEFPAYFSQARDPSDRPPAPERRRATKRAPGKKRQRG